MTRFVVDCGVVLHLSAEEIEVSQEHELLASTPTVDALTRPS